MFIIVIQHRRSLSMARLSNQAQGRANEVEDVIKESHFVIRQSGQTL
jgi:hypothetical protein